PATLELASAAMLIAVLLGIPLGLWAGLKPRSAAGRTIMAGSILGFSLPTFWVGLMLIFVFSVWLGWLPTSGRGPTVNLIGIPVSFLTPEGLRHLVLPAANLALFNLSLLVARSAGAGRRNKVTPSGRIAAEFAASRIALAGLALLALVLLAALLAPWISPQNPYDLARLDLLDSRLPPGARSAAGATYWLGTDDQGRDMLSAILYGLRTSVAVGFANTAPGPAIGLSLGLASA